MRILPLLALLCAPLAVESAEWWRHQNDPLGFYLYEGDVMIGRWDAIHQRYTAVAGTTQPASLPELPQDTRDFGVDLDQLRPSVSISGRSCSEQEALQAIQDASLPQDNSNLRLTIIGPDADRAQVLQDLQTHPALLPLVQNLVIQDYEPGNWATTVGFVQSGRPTIYLQSPDGKVLHRQDDYRDGADGLAGAIRRANQNYNPQQDPDLRKTDLNLPLILAGIGLLILFLGKDEKQ